MKQLLIGLFVFPAFFLSGTALLGQTDSCIKCHSELEDELLAPVKDFAQDVHSQVGLSCSDCHGGNPKEEDADLAMGSTFKDTPSRREIPQFCASCHSDISYMRRYNPSLRVDQLALYETSYHGQMLKKGDTKVAVCTDCHGTHSIRPASHPKALTFPWNIPDTCGRCHSDKNYMKGYKLSTNEEADYKKSVHANALYEKKDLSAPVCNDCHGNHGATPPEVASIAQVCRQCHPSTGDLFSGSPHKKAYDEMGFSECEVCHGNHKILKPSDEMIGVGEKAVCIQCHEEGSLPYKVASLISQKIQTFSTKINKASEIIQRANQLGVEVSEPQFKLKEANTTLIMMRNLTHSLSLPLIDEKIVEGDKVVDEVTREGEAALKEAKFRRIGLVTATSFLFLLCIALFLKIRQISRKEPRQQS